MRLPLGDAATSSVPSISASRTFTCCVREVGHVLADEVGADRQLAVPAVDQHGQLHGARPAEVAQRVERGAHRPAGEEDVVDEDDEPVVDAAVGQHASAPARGRRAAAGRRGRG